MFRALASFPINALADFAVLSSEVAIFPVVHIQRPSEKENRQLLGLFSFRPVGRSGVR